mmetsp:Transcript_15455/g.33736  ORF Transcript_15455/g.33736 Transcript_15455/m.33736 type:complete len:236 (+) Transcript_15455:2306-3013(+)
MGGNIQSRRMTRSVHEQFTGHFPREQTRYNGLRTFGFTEHKTLLTTNNHIVAQKENNGKESNRSNRHGIGIGRDGHKVIFIFIAGVNDDFVFAVEQAFQCGSVYKTVEIVAVSHGIVVSVVQIPGTNVIRVLAVNSIRVNLGAITRINNHGNTSLVFLQNVCQKRSPGNGSRQVPRHGFRSGSVTIDSPWGQRSRYGNDRQRMRHLFLTFRRHEGTSKQGCHLGGFTQNGNVSGH